MHLDQKGERKGTAQARSMRTESSGARWPPRWRTPRVQRRSLPRTTREPRGDSDPFHHNRGISEHGQRPEVLGILGEHGTSGPFRECDDDRVDSGAAASSGPQLRGAASDGLVNCFHIAHPEKPLFKEVPAGIAPERLREDDRRDNRGPQAGASKPAESLSRGNAALGQPG